MSKFYVGQRVVLTGDEWSSEDAEWTGTLGTVVSVGMSGIPAFTVDKDRVSPTHAYIAVSGWEVEGL